MAAHIIGWDIGGAHVKASWVERGAQGPLLRDAAEWACPLWQGLPHLRAALAAAAERWPVMRGATHAVTMSGEMVDLFEHREAGVAALAAELGAALVGPLRFFAGESRWCAPGDVARHWRAIASANWLATASWAARRVPDGVLLDIGSTTTDIVALRGGCVGVAGRSDAGRLASGELVYHGVVRTPLCALGPRIEFRGHGVNVINEFFATSADVYRLTGGLDPAHDLQPSADGAAKDAPASRRRLARMVGLDARDASDGDWLALARAWRAAQLRELRHNLARVIEAAQVPAQAPIIAAGCGDFLAGELAASLERRCLDFASLVAKAPAHDGAPDREAVDANAQAPAAPAALARRVQVAAPSAAVALLCATVQPDEARG